MSTQHNQLTPQEKKAIEYFAKGFGRVDAVEKSYNVSNRHSAESLADKVFKRKRVVEELKKIEELNREKLSEENIKFIDIVDTLISQREVAQILVKNIRSNDRRMSDVALEKYLKLKNAYPPPTLGLYHDLEKEREKVLTEADIVKQYLPKSDERAGLLEEGPEEEKVADKKKINNK